MNHVCNLLENNINNIKNIKNIKNNSKCYYFLESILRLIDIDLNNLNRDEIISNLNIFRIKLGNDLILENIYKLLPNKLRLSKNSIYLKLINNDCCDENIYKYVSYYLELNILIFTNNTYRFVNEYDKDINTIILVEKNKIKFVPLYITDNQNKLYNMYDNIVIDNLLLKFELNKKIIFNNKNEINEEELKKINKLKNSKLYELQELCEIYNINIKETNNLKFKKKIHIFEELKNKLINDIKLI
tara:strand:- start:11 stop:742 length:732 start_codon:yes stop_codon:yes gene_type:complete